MEAGLGGGEKLPNPNPTELGNVWQSKELHSESWQLVPEPQRAEMMSPTLTGPLEGKSTPIYISCDSRVHKAQQKPQQSLTKLRQDRPLLPRPANPKPNCEARERGVTLLGLVHAAKLCNQNAKHWCGDRQTGLGELYKYEDLQKTRKIWA